jgi:hypothetical protein
MAHAARSAFPADVFDEFLCYQLSSSALRRVCGPFFSHLPYSRGWLLGSTLAIVSSLALALDLYLEGGLPSDLSWALAYLPSVSLFFICALFCSFLRQQSRWNKCQQKLQSKYGALGRQLLFCLTQKEAEQIASDQLQMEQLAGSSSPRSLVIGALLRQ